MNEDLELMSEEELRQEVLKLRAGIRKHHDCSGHDLCWYHPELWGLVPDLTTQSPTVPRTCEFIENCIRYRKSLDK